MFSVNDKFALLNDFYEYTMANGFHEAGIGDKIVYFDMFFRTVPDGAGFAIACGLNELIDYITKLRFDDSDIEYLRSKNCFSESWLEALRNFHFSGDIWAVPEGTVVFKNEP
ncbi:MAG: nicotinate phosphoribosyltransferase, partial [Oscillospiraceae bacterium]|nr:nicotinate phosphoribosyltransferase [Oscillospiraceae bacterium]